MLRQIKSLGTFSWLLMAVVGMAAAGCSGASPESGEDVAPQTDAAGDDSTDDATTAGPAPVEPTLLSEAELAEGWISLFDGATLFGWTKESNANWRVENGTIVVDEGEQGLLCTTTEFTDYVLKLDFRSAKGTNSGIFLHTPKKPADPATDCYELNIADSDNPFPTGSLVKRKKAEGNFDSADWKTYEITVEGDIVLVKLDDRLVMDYQDENPLWRGFIGLQLNSGKVEFRNIKLKPLGLETIFNGEDLTGWQTYPNMKSEFTATEKGELHVKGGPGQLESENQFGDFVLQLECISHAAGLNSGIFFRCIPGEQMNGYESQIHNGYEGSDRTKPVDCGTGGIFRRQHARRVVADDKQWFHKTIIADGPHMAVWVNGYQVSDWTDTRAPDENPRRGLRLERGTLMIQGHDDTTDLSFRNFKAREMAPRSEPEAAAP